MKRYTMKMSDRIIRVSLMSLLITGLAACGNVVSFVDAGQLGVMRGPDGLPVIAVMTCHRGTPVVSLSEGRRPSDPENQPNVLRGSWQARTSSAGVRQLRLAGPGTGWTTARDPGMLQPDRLFIVDAGTTEDEAASLTPVDFHTAQLATLGPDQVLTAGHVVSLSAFRTYTCG